MFRPYNNNDNNNDNNATYTTERNIKNHRIDCSRIENRGNQMDAAKYGDS